MKQVELKKGIVQCSYPNRYEQLNNLMPHSSDSSIEQTELLNNREYLLNEYRKVQPFRVSTGKKLWVDYEKFKPEYNLREILNNEIVIEFDSPYLNLNWEAINETAINLYKANITFEIWDHKGKSPHLHIHNLPLSTLDKEKRAIFKKVFIRTYVPKKYLPFVDLSLTGIHLIALEWAFHWKGCYDFKKLLYKFEPIQDGVGGSL